MDIVYLLIPLSVLLVFLIGLVFWWSLRNGQFEDLDGPIRLVTSLDTPVPYSPPLENYFLPNAAKVADSARELAHY